MKSRRQRQATTRREKQALASLAERRDSHFWSREKMRSTSSLLLCNKESRSNRVKEGSEVDSTGLVKKGQQDSPFPTLYPGRNGVKKRKSPEWRVKGNEKKDQSPRGAVSFVDHLAQSASRRD